MAHRAPYRDAPPNHMSRMHGYGYGYGQHDGGEFREGRKRGSPEDLLLERAPRRCLDRVSAPAGRHHGWEDSPGRRPTGVTKNPAAATIQAPRYKEEAQDLSAMPAEVADGPGSEGLA